ncbi:nitrate/nitrite transporter [Tuwongella immobilis]|uniref:Major facilitator superfamily (MFS) profile domain-containing protein n=1 Tax=Tuwongella immobilis TaxID=692036 RepID=A0A6C2YHZ0_9BACT|nr:nitrate/nitrite transporter [Tuwongella immobilis]VIP00984.1 nitrate nitrite transporter integral membrane protein : NarK1 protein OS=Thermus scotoductus (strain ATCC 700910 / SA-01) GN=TSC_c17470 PE=4 SV=1: MFS_1 [Tuwongella immobilis]VTR97386.1 nitrate nitrite transporter integral membrane protein : NarK1 protein OS=Thermus scotoductus (strain ATCC 700910 / SA-01) GN=TSC_c17470 PE=4 SV=1: MFS_1 [Tuwongella immobilis]
MTNAPESLERTVSDRQRVLWLSTIAFTLLFAVWMMLGILGVRIRDELQLSASQLDWLLAVAILAGSLPRLHFGIWTDRSGGRLMMTGILLATALPTFWVSQIHSYGELLIAAALFGLAGNSFTVGIAWNSAWFPDARKGTALGIFGAGNVGASVTKFLAPALLATIPTAGLAGGLIPGGWRLIPMVYSVLLVLMAVAVWWWAPTPERCPGRGRRMAEVLAPLNHMRVWRFSLYYVVVFGAYVALAAYLPRYYVDVYQITLQNAGFLTALFIFPASLLRPVGGWLSDRFGPRIVTYAVFGIMTIALGILAIPANVWDVGVVGFTVLIVIVGCGMGIGKASVYKYIPNYFPHDVGAVGGLVGMLGALGGFVLPPAFGICSRSLGTPQAAFLALFLVTLASLIWLHRVVMRLQAERGSVRLADAVGASAPTN